MRKVFIPNVTENPDLGPSQSPGGGRSQLVRISNTDDVEIAPTAGAFASVLNRIFSHIRYIPLFAVLLLVLAGCETSRVIVNDVEEREANEIIVFLSSHGINAGKTASSSSPGATAQSNVTLWSIIVPEEDMTQAMAILNQNGLPRKKGPNLLDLFAKQSLMSSEKEETIRYQAGLEQQIANTIRKIDGVIDADVQLSFPPAETGLPGTAVAVPTRVTAAVYVKHQGVVDDPNSHLVAKIKRLVAGSVNGLDINDVTVISDRSRFTDVTIGEQPEAASAQIKDYVSIWSIVLSKQSAPRFRFLFFSLIITNIIFVAALGWVLWKFYPVLRENGGFKQLLDPLPLKTNETEKPK